MEASIKGQQDFLSGLLFILIGLAFVSVGWRLPIGSVTQMGPGYIPLGAASILIVLGLACAVRGLVTHGARLDPIVWRPIVFVAGAVLAFGLSLERLGLVAAILLAVFIGRLAIPHARFVSTLALAIGLVVLCVALFHYGFGVPAPVWPRLL